MADSQLWLQHLSSSLRVNRQVAYLYRVHEDKYEFIGDVMGVLGVREEEFPRTKDDFKRLVAPEDLVTRQIGMADILAKSATGEKNFSLKYKLVRSDGTLIPVVETGIVRRDPDSGSPTVQSLMSLDVETIEQQKRFSRAAAFRESVETVVVAGGDRRALLDSLEKWRDEQESDGENKGFLILLSLDRMSLVNEIYGTSIADDLLSHVDNSLRRIIGPASEVFRIAGDSFAMFFPTRDCGEMRDLAHNLLKFFYQRPMEIQGHSIHQVVSIGGVRLCRREMSPSSILTRVELALADAKQRGRGCFIEYSEKLEKQVQEFRDVLSIGDNFLRGFHDGRVKMAFQGIVSTRTSAVSFHECLIRLIDENGDIHSAGRFIDAIERMGLTRLVDTFASREAIRELKDFPTISLSVNVSNHTFTDPDWLKAVVMELRDHPDVASRLIVEITESVAMTDINQTLRVVRQLQDLGCRIALDDFGAGHTAFSHLKDLSLDIVKIDKQFVRDMDKQENKLFIRTLHSLASAMNLETVGEGAETLAEADILAKDGIDHIQGFVYGMPSLDRPWLAIDPLLKN